jgi:hypothetical protein
VRKIPTLFARDRNNPSRVLNIPNLDCAWVFEGEGVATRKYDGTCVALDGYSNWYARREVKPNQALPPDFEEVNFDEVTGKRVGWVPMAHSSFAKYHAEALNNGDHPWEPGTYELIGPKINGNPERSQIHQLIEHASARILDAPRAFDELDRYLEVADIEGIVWHHPDGRMAKLKGRDFGYRRADR